MKPSMLCGKYRVFATCVRFVPLLLTTACQSGSPVAVPARMVAAHTTEQCLAQMQKAAQRADGHRVVLTTAAFAQTDRLSIGPAQTVLDAAGQPADGRMRGLPDSYRLTLIHGVCTMTREADGQATPLTDCSCTALP